jgi:adenylate cyclase
MPEQVRRRLEMGAVQVTDPPRRDKGVRVQTGAKDREPPYSLGMDRIWQWAWDRYGPRYSWAYFAVGFLLALPVNIFMPFIVVAYEGSNRYVLAAIISIGVELVMVYCVILPGQGEIRRLERWAAGEQVDSREALKATYTWARGAVARGAASSAVSGAVMLVLVGMTAGASGWRVVQYGVIGAASSTGAYLVAAHAFVEGALRPVRIAVCGATSVGDLLPRSRPSFAAWSATAMVSTAFTFAVSGAALAAVFIRLSEGPLLWLVIGCAMTIGFGVPITFSAAFSPALRPIRDLAEGTKRVGAGDYSQRLPVVQDDDLGALAGSFNRMQAGLIERQRLHAAFGTYVDPSLAARLLEQGDDVFTGERREVTVMFVDVRDFTPFAEANTAEDTVARLNALFEMVVPAVVNAGGHVNKFLGDGALALFGAPNDLADHADAAVNAAVLIQRLVGERFGGALRIGIGINTGVVIAGTIGGGGKLEFTLIGDAVNVAARVEQLTKTTGDTILLTQQTVDALTARPPELIDRGAHELKGKSAQVRLFGL